MEPWSLPGRERTAAIVVTYQPDDALPERLHRVSVQVATVIVVDNSPARPVRQQLSDPASAGMVIIHNEQNLGIAAALNQGMRRALDLGYSWTLTLDQDSTVDPDLVDSLAAIYRMYPDQSRVAVINSNSRSRHSGRVALRCRERARPYVECTTVITSGSLISLAAYTHAGPFREDFFIEGVDLEYCLRLRRNGYKILSSCRPLMTHAAGKMEEVRFLGRNVLVPHHAPWRYYYMVRNFALIVRGYFRQEPRWVFAAAIGVAKMMVRVVLFERDRRAKFAAMLRGLRDAAAASWQPTAETR